MLSASRVRPNYATVTATLALFTALSGGAYAALQLPAGSVRCAATQEGRRRDGEAAKRCRDRAEGPRQTR
jgi:hypothetical protein